MFQQNESGALKTAGILLHEPGISLSCVSIEQHLPEIVEEPELLLPEEISADLVLDFLVHPDLSEGLWKICASKEIPVVASARRSFMENVLDPPT